MTAPHINPSRLALSRGLTNAALLLGAAVVTRALAPAYLSPEMARRTMGMLFGAIVVIHANDIPKALLPLSATRDPIVDQAIRRFAGWSLVAGGLAYMAAWLFAPLANANVLAAGMLGVSLLLVGARVARAR